MNELHAAIYSRLSGGTALINALGGTAIFHMQAREGQSYPYVVWNIQGGGDENLTPNRTKNYVLFVRCYSENSAAQAGSIDAQVDALLHLNPVAPSGWTGMWMARESDMETVEYEPSGSPVYMRGGMYRLMLDKN